MIGYTVFRRRRRASGIGSNCARISNNTNTKLRTITATFLAGIFTLSIFSQLTAYAAGNLSKIKTAEITEISTTAEGNITSYDDENIVSNIEFHQLNDEAKFKVILENTSAKDHVIETIEDDNTNPYIIYVYDNHAGETIAAGSELVFEFVAKYETQAAMDARAVASNVKFFIKYTEVEEPDEIELLVPNTGWGTVIGTESNRTVIRISTIATIISGAALIVICVTTIIRRKQSRNRRTVRSARRVAVVVLALAAITVSATVRAINVETSSFTLTTNYTLKDRLQVTWTDAEGNEHEEIVNFNEPVNIPEQTKEGHTLTGWEDENGNPVDPTQPFTDDTKIRPVFRAHKYTIKFNGNGTTDGAMDNLEMTFGEAKTLPANAFVWSGHTYTGWDTEANGSGAHYGDQDNVADLTTEDNVIVNLYAQWSINPFHIDYDGNEATSGEMATTNCEYDQECTLRENTFARTGYDFKGWTYNGADYADKADVTNIIENGTITMVAKWELHEYTITYLGLTDEEKSALHAQGNPDTYTILTPSFTLHNPEDRYDADGDKTQHFEGWRESTVSTTITLPQTDSLSNKIYEAIWSDVATPEYTVTYDYDGGDVATANKTKFTKFESFTMNEPVKEGYTFTGWTGTDVTTETKPYTVPTGVRHNLEFTAHYRKNTYSVAFDINTDDTNISGSMSLVTGLEYDTNYNLTANAFARTGYTFGGWNTQADGQGNDYADQGEFNNLTAEDGGTATLYAKWNPTQYTIVFHANNENVENPDAMAAQVVTYDVETALNPIEYTWWQHKLVEWTTNANGTGTKYADKATIKNLNANGGEVHLYAKWREIDAALQAGGVGRSSTGTRINTLLAANPDAKRFVKYTAGIPSDEVLANAVDTSGTIDPIWLWVEGENLYWWSEDVKPRISSRLTSTDCLFNGAGTYTVDGVTKHLEYADLTGFDTSNITDYGRTFHSSGILEINISDWDFSHATNMSEFIAWGLVKKATFPEIVDARNVTNMSLALNFGMVTDELDLSGWKTRDVKNLSNFLLGMQAKKIKFSSDFKTDNVESMASMFSGNSRLTSIEGLEYFDTAKVKNMSNMFASVSSMESLDLSTFSTAALTNMNGMFSGMSSLTSLTLGGSFTANDVIGFTNTFKGLAKLQTIDLSNLTSTPTDMSNMFESSSGAKVIDISGMDLSAVTKFTYTFIACGNLETIYVSNNPNQENITDDGHIFLYSGPKIVGGAGSNHLGSAAGTGNGGGEGQSVYARIDDPDNGNPGYFTPKDSIYIRYHDNDGDDTNDEVNYALMPSYYVSTAEPYGVKLRTNAFEKEHYKFMGWATSADGEVVYADGAALEGVAASKNPLDLYAVWKERSAMLDTGANVNVILRNLAEAPTSFSRYNDTPNFETIEGEQNIALPDSSFPVYAWYDENDQAIYWWSEADKPTMNMNSASFFNGVHNAGTASAPNNVANSLSKLESIDMTGLDASAAKDMTRLFANTKALNSLNLSDFDSSSATNMDGMFAGTALKNVDLSLIEAGNVTSMASMFQSTKFNTLDFSNFDTHNVKLMSNMFTSAVMTNLDLSTLDTSSVTNMANMFKSSNITTLTFFDAENPTATKFDTSKVTTISEMFRESKTKTLDLSQFNTSAVTSMYGVFYSAAVSDLNVSNWDTSNVTSMYIMFFAAANLTSLNLSHFNTAKVTNMQQMFDSTTKLKYLNVSNWSNDKVANMSYMFQDVGRGTAGEVTIVFDGFKTPSVTNMTRMFARYNDHNLKVLDLSSFDTSKVTSMGTMFGGGRQDTMIHNAMFDTIYVSDKFTNAGVSSTTEVFNRTSTVIGGAGTTWSQDHMTADYARIDDPDNGEPGYFTLKDSIYVRYHDNDGDAANDEANYALMPSHYVSTMGTNTLRTNAFVRDHYKFMGWAKTADGEVVYADGATISEEASKTPLELYAQWEPTIATVTFNANHNDATGSMQPQTVTGGVQTTLMANGFDVPHWRFLGWTTEAQPNVISNENADVDFVNQADVTNLAENTELYGKWLFRCRTFETDSWATIVANLANDPNYYDATDGCQKEVEIDIVGSDGKWGSDGVNESYTVMLTNTSTPEECATEGFSQTACGTVIEFVDKVAERRWTNKSGTNAVAGGWKASELAGWLNGDFYEKLPDDLKQVIIPSYIVSSNAGGLESPDITLGDANLNKIYLYSTKELGQPRTSTSNIEDNKIDSTRVADFYNIADNRSNYINRGSQLNNQWHSWWLRSSVLQRNNLPHDVQTVVTAGPGAENALGIFPVFRIGIPRYSYTNCVDGSTFETEIYLGNDYPCYDPDFIVTKDDTTARSAYPTNITVYDVPGGIIVEPYNDSISTGPLVPWVQGTIRVKAAENTRVLNYQALAGFRSAKTIMLPNALTTIGNESLRLIPQMEFLALPDSVQSIGDNALKDCSSLTAILYRGTIYTTTSALTSALAENGVALGSNIFSGVPMPTE